MNLLGDLRNRICQSLSIALVVFCFIPLLVFVSLGL